MTANYDEDALNGEEKWKNCDESDLANGVDDGNNNDEENGDEDDDGKDGNGSNDGGNGDDDSDNGSNDGGNGDDDSGNKKGIFYDSGCGKGWFSHGKMCYKLSKKNKKFNAAKKSHLAVLKDPATLAAVLKGVGLGDDE